MSDIEEENQKYYPRGDNIQNPLDGCEDFEVSQFNGCNYCQMKVYVTDTTDRVHTYRLWRLLLQNMRQSRYTMTHNVHTIDSFGQHYFHVCHKLCHFAGYYYTLYSWDQSQIAQTSTFLQNELMNYIQMRCTGVPLDSNGPVSYDIKPGSMIIKQGIFDNDELENYMYLPPWERGSQSAFDISDTITGLSVPETLTEAM